MASTTTTTVMNDSTFRKVKKPVFRSFRKVTNSNTNNQIVSDDDELMEQPLSKPSIMNALLRHGSRRNSSASTINCSALSMRTTSSTGVRSVGRSASLHNTTKTMNIRDTDWNVMEWLEYACPNEIVPKILAFTGPKQTQQLASMNVFWKNMIVHNEFTWRVLCEDLYKWKKGDDKPESWEEFYRSRPCVPIDYSSIPKALEQVTSTSLSTNRGYRGRSSTSSNTTEKSQTSSITILLRPGKYILKHAIDIRASTGAVVSMETIQLPNNLFHTPHGTSSSRIHTPSARTINEHRGTSPQQQNPSSDGSRRTSTKHKLSRMRTMFSCKQNESIEDTEIEDFSDEWLDHDQPFVDHHNLNSSSSTSFFSNTPLSQHHHHPHNNTACLILRSRKSNEPTFRVLQGVLRLTNVEIQHNSHGMDIWNGNAAVQIQPPLGPDDQPLEVQPRPTAVLDRVQITSGSGRGIVNVDGGKVVIRRCVVRDCAATGLYIGGPGSTTYVDQSDVIRNGVGNRSSGRGIARGHSGVYLEQGLVKISNSNISDNILTGISVVSPDNAMIRLESSTLISNGTHQLEQPPPNSPSFQRSTITANNTLSPTGTAQLRSGLTVIDRATTSSSTRISDVGRLRADHPLLMNPNLFRVD